MRSASIVAILWAFASYHALLAQEKGDENAEDFVTQTPSALNVTRGSSMTLTCQLHLRSKRTIKMVSFTWSTAHKNYTCTASSSTGGNEGESTQETTLPCIEGLTLNISLKRAELTLDGVLEKDAGVYICNVAILQPAPRQDLHGNGTVIRITEPLPSSGGLPSYLPATVAAGAGLILLLIVAIPLIMKVKACNGCNCGADPLGDAQIVRTGTIYANIQCSPRAARSGNNAPVSREPQIIYSELKLSPPRNTEQCYLTRD